MTNNELNEDVAVSQFNCAMNGIECEYGICDECPVVTGYKY